MNIFHTDSWIIISKLLIRKKQQAVEKRHVCRPKLKSDKAKFGEKAGVMFINEHFEENFNAVLTSAIVFQWPVSAYPCVWNSIFGSGSS